MEENPLTAHLGWGFRTNGHVNKEMSWDIYCNAWGILEALLLWGLLSSVGFYPNSKIVRELVVECKIIILGKMKIWNLLV